MNWNDLENKRVHVILQNDFEYTGLITGVDDRGNGLIFFTLTSKFNEKILFVSSEIKRLEVKE